MYVSGEGSGKERREARRRAADAGGKKHTITKRQKAVQSFAIQQVKDTAIAAAAAVAISAYMCTIGAPHAISAITLGIAAFIGKKGINAISRFGKKHTIKKRVLSNGKVKKGLILTAAGVLPLLVTGVPVVSIVSVAATASVLAAKAKKAKKAAQELSGEKEEEKVSIRKRKKKKGGKAK